MGIPIAKRIYFELKELFEKTNKIYSQRMLYRILLKKEKNLTSANLTNILKRYFLKNRLVIDYPNLFVYGNEKVIKKIKRYIYE